MELKRKPVRGLCPNCKEHCAPAILASEEQATILARKSWSAVPSNRVVEAVESLGLNATSPGGVFLADLSKITRPRNDIANSDHLIAHRHILGRSGFANGELKSRRGVMSVLSRETTKPFFPRPSLRDSPTVMGKFIEAELELRAKRRCLKLLSLTSESLVYQHPILHLPINVEIDGQADSMPVELKTVSSFCKISPKIFGIMMQLAGQAIAKGVDSGILIIAERDGERLTAVCVSGLTKFHLKNIERWVSEASQEGVLA